MIHIIPVTARDIQNGKAGSAHACPIALAMKDRLSIYDILVDEEIQFLHPEEGDYTIDCQPAIRSFIYDFDAEQQVYPFTLIINTDTCLASVFEIHEPPRTGALECRDWLPPNHPGRLLDCQCPYHTAGLEALEQI